MTRPPLLLPLLAACAGDSYAADDFSYSDEDWALDSEFSLPTMSIVELSSTGLPPYICGHDTGFSGARFWQFKAPPKYHGNADRAFRQRLTWSTMTEFSSGRLLSTGDVTLTGRGLSLIATIDNVPRSTRIWEEFSVYLDARTEWRKQADGYPLATDDEIHSVLKTMTDLKLPGEWRDGEETTCIDNVYFGSP